MSRLGTWQVRVVLVAALVAFAAAQIATDAPPMSDKRRGDPDPPKMREQFAQRSPACVACQRAVAHLDENMLPKVFDERSKVNRDGKSTYGRFSKIVEDDVSGMCRAQPIQMERETRQACLKMLEEHEEAIVKAWYETAVVDEMNATEEANMNWILCSQSRGIAAVCPDELAKLDVPTLVRLETRRRWEKTRRRNDEELRRRDTKRRKLGGGSFNSESEFNRERDDDPRLERQPKRLSMREIPRPPIGSGRLETFVSSDFTRRAIGGGDRGGDADVTDVLVYFAYPRKNPGKHAATMDTLAAVAHAVAKAARMRPKQGPTTALGGGGRGRTRPRGGVRGPESITGESHTTLVAMIDAERNEIPHPWGASIDGPALILFPAGAKDKPRLLPFRDAGSGTDSDSPSDAPTPADALTLLQKRGGRPETREVAGEAFVRMDQRVLEGAGRDTFEDGNDEL
jgi:hypothetical protein